MHLRWLFEINFNTCNSNCHDQSQKVIVSMEIFKHQIRVICMFLLTGFYSRRTVMSSGRKLCSFWVPQQSWIIWLRLLLWCLKILLRWGSKLWVRIPLRRGVLDATLCDKVCQWLATDQWFSPGPPVSSTNKTDRHDIWLKYCWKWH